MQRSVWDEYVAGGVSALTHYSYDVKNDIVNITPIPLGTSSGSTTTEWEER
ncbi:MAG: hypothetical protein PXY39_14370 [archaeon]|nr:hypothetical protein [archaeon]